MKLCLVSLLFQIFATLSSASCSASDWKTMIGNPGFDIYSIKSAVNSQGDILVAGLMEMKYTSVLSAFVYLLKDEDCSVPWKYQISAITNSFDGVAWSHDEAYAYIIGSGAVNDYLVVVQDPYVTNTNSPDGAGTLSVWNLGAFIQDTHSLIPHPYLNYQVFAIRGYGMTKI